MKANYLSPLSILWQPGRHIRIFILHVVKWQQITRNSVIFCFVLFCEITCHINSVPYFCHMQWRTWQEICLLGLLSLGRGVVGSNIYFFKYCCVSKNISKILWDIKLIYVYKVECLIFRRNEICVRLFKGVVSTADVVHNRTRCKMTNRNGGPLKDLSWARHSIPQLTYSGIYLVTLRKIRLLQIVINKVYFHGIHHDVLR
jgi:hypothetical protein